MTAKLRYAEYQGEKIRLSPLSLKGDEMCSKLAVILNPADYEFFLFSSSKSRRWNFDTRAAGRYLAAQYPGSPFHPRVIIYKTGDNYIFILLNNKLKPLFDELSIRVHLFFPFQCFSSYAGTCQRLISYFYYADWLQGAYWENGFLRSLETIKAHGKLADSLSGLDTCLEVPDGRTRRVLCSPAASELNSDFCIEQEIEMLPLRDLICNSEKTKRSAKKYFKVVLSCTLRPFRSPFIALKLCSLLKPIMIALLLMLITAAFTFAVNERKQRVSLQRNYQLLKQSPALSNKSPQSGGAALEAGYNHEVRRTICLIEDLFSITKILAESNLELELEALTLYDRRFSLRLICKEPWKLREIFAAAGMKNLRINGNSYLELSGVLAHEKADN